jgi:hypothetical protein
MEVQLEEEILVMVAMGIIEAEAVEAQVAMAQMLATMMEETVAQVTFPI